MYLSRLVVRNYRSIKSLDIKFEKGKNIILGRNNAGKSNIVKAIDLVLGESSPTWNKSENITGNDFYSGDTSNEIFIWYELDRNVDSDSMLEELDFTEIQDSAIARIVKNDRNGNSPYKINISEFSEDEIENIFEYYTEEGDAKLSDNSSGFKKYWVGEKTYRKTDFQTEFKDVQKIVFAFRATKSAEEIKKVLAFLYTNDGINWSIAVGGGNIRSCFLQSAIIPAFRPLRLGPS